MRAALNVKRRLAVAGLTVACTLAVAIPASAQTGGTGTPGSTTTTTTTTTSPTPLAPPGRAKLRKDGTAVAPADAPLEIQAAIAAGNAIKAMPYRWGGGHRTFYDSGYDCSGAVSYVLHAAGMLESPMPSGPLATGWGAPGKGRWITVFAERKSRLHGGGGPSLRHLGGRREAEPGQWPAVAEDEAQAPRLHAEVLAGLLGRSGTPIAFRSSTGTD